MAQNDPGSNKLIKICPDCSYRNDVSFRRCSQCGQSLAGIKIQPESLPTAPLQQLLADETSTNTTIIGIPPVQQSDTQQMLQSGQSATNGSRQDIHVAPPIASYPDKQLVNTPLPGLSSYQVSSNGNSSRNTKSKRNRLIGLIMIILAFLVIAALLLHNFGTPSNSVSPKSSPIGLGEFKASNGELLGINDGSLAPFLLGPDGQLKQQAADQLKHHQLDKAITSLQDALNITNEKANTNNDAEAWIYLENQLVLLGRLPYITLVAGTDLLEPSGSGLSDLQGIYVAQHAFNNENHGFRIRILIANSGTDINNVTPIAQRIVNIANQDKTVVGVISWLSSAENIIALPILAAAHIPMISPAASSDKLTDISSFFFRIVPPNHIQGKVAALFAEHTLHTRKAVVFVDKQDTYSQNLAQDFEKQFRQDGNSVLKEELFTTDHTAKIGDLIQKALTMTPDLLYFTSRDTSDAANFQDALPPPGTFAPFVALSGDAGYVIHKAGDGRWYFASFAFANAVDNLIGTIPPFYQNYSDDFNQDGLKPPGYYGYTRPDDITMLSYDVTSVFLKAMQQAIANNKIAITSDGLQLVTPALLANTLPNIALQGVSGQIAFDSDHNPVNKAIVFLAASSDGHTYMKDWQGCFTKDLCHNVS